MKNNAEKIVQEVRHVLAKNGWLLDDKVVLDLAIYVIGREKQAIKSLEIIPLNTENGDVTLAYIFDDLDRFKDENWGYIETHPNTLGSDDLFYKYLKETYPVIFREADSSDTVYAEKIVIMGKAN